MVTEPLRPYYETPDCTLYLGNCFDVLTTLQNDSVHMICTSPPYFGLRAYHGEAIIIGGDRACTHVWSGIVYLDTRGSGTDDGATGRQRGETYGRNAPRGRYCSICQAWCGELGLEVTPAEYVDHLVTVFHEARRVLRQDGTMFLNLGDSYANDAKWGGKHVTALHGEPIGRERRYTGLKPKDLIGIPWRTALALQDDGWWLRSAIVWDKPNAMPDPTKDRPTQSHEYVFLLSKAERYRFFAEAIAEPSVSDRPSGNGFKRPQQISRGGRRAQAVWEPQPTRNARSVWQINTEQYPGSHFGVMPSALAERCILSGSAVGDTILDPFAGVGTSSMTARRLNRRSIGIELSEDYCKQAIRRIESQTPTLQPQTLHPA